MSTGRLDRLLAIRRLAEQVERGSLENAAASVAEVERALAMHREALAAVRCAARAAMSEGDREACLMAEAQTEVSQWCLAQLHPLLASREAAVAPAMERFLDSRREREQIERLVLNAEETVRAGEARRAQAAVDEWFLARSSRPARRQL